MSGSAFLKTIASRRTHYALQNTLPEGVTIEQVQSIVQHLVKYTPTTFNSQSIRAVILTGELHKKVWDQVVNSIEGDKGRKRPISIRDEAYGSVVFAIDSATTKQFQENIQFLAPFFPNWGVTANGAAQINTWAALQEIGLGGHLQHYNDAVKAALGDKIPGSWELESQLIFGTPVAQPYEKTFIDNEVKVLDQ